MSEKTVVFVSVKVINQLAKEVRLRLRQAVPTSSFDVTEDSMKQALASGLIIEQQKGIANPPTFVNVTKNYQRRARNTPALSNISSMSDGVNGATGRAKSLAISSSNLSSPGSFNSAGSLGVS